MIRLLLADDHPIITQGLSNLLAPEPEIDIVSICANGLEVLSALTRYEIDLILMDIEMPEMNGFECAETVLQKYPSQKIAMLTMHKEKSLIQKFLSMGVKGYFLKTVEQDELLHGIKMIHKGGEYFPADVTKTLLQPEVLSPTLNQDPRIKDLSTREIEILKQVAMGMSNKMIAEKLFISHRTVDTHRTNLMKKLDIHNIAGLIRFAFKNQLVE
ncbi:MAG: response regulator transcription factor [Bacteroidota bacterium]